MIFCELRQLLLLLALLIGLAKTNPEGPLLIIGGNRLDLSNASSTVAIAGSSLCFSNLPAIPIGTNAGILEILPHPRSRSKVSDNETGSQDHHETEINPSSAVFCGGWDKNFRLSSDCWKFNPVAGSWDKSAFLPYPLAGMASGVVGGNVWLFGGLQEQDYYDQQDLDKEEYYYDYVIEQSGSAILRFDGAFEKWELSTLAMPYPLQGACGVTCGGLIYILGGKNELDLLGGTDAIHLFEAQSEQWKTDIKIPALPRKAYYQGCSHSNVNGTWGLLVAGGHGQNPEDLGMFVDFLPLNPNCLPDEESQWISLPDLTFPHQNVPSIGVSQGHIIVAGGGGYPLPGGQKMVELLVGNTWLAYPVLPDEIAFASSAQVPSSWFQSCSMVPNLGINRFHQDKLMAQLKDLHWFCQEEQLWTASPTQKSVTLLKEGCTLQDCHFPYQLMRQKVSTFGGALTCHLEHLGTPRQRVACLIDCKDRWSPNLGTDAIFCPGETSLKPRGITNFTSDYMECVFNP